MLARAHSAGPPRCAGEARRAATVAGRRASSLPAALPPARATSAAQRAPQAPASAQAPAPAPAPAPAAAPFGPSSQARAGSPLPRPITRLPAPAACDDSLEASLQACPPAAAAARLRMWLSESAFVPAGGDCARSLSLPCGVRVACRTAVGRTAHAWKPENQDAFFARAVTSTQGDERSPGADARRRKGALLLGLFDGHGRHGGQAARIARDAMLRVAEKAMIRLGARGGADAPEPRREVPGATPGAEPPPSSPRVTPEELLSSAFEEASRVLRGSRLDCSRSGTTAVLCLANAEGVRVAWVGDSRAVLIDANPALPPRRLTRDHRPDSPAERARIIRAGGSVRCVARDRRGRPLGPHRLCYPGGSRPGLALSRALGDTAAARIGLLEEPEYSGAEFGATGGADRPAADAALPSRAAVPPVAAPPAAAPLASPGGWGVHQRSFSRLDIFPTRPVFLDHSDRDEGDERARAAPGPQARTSASHHSLIVATDGLWEFVSEEEAACVVRACDDPESAAAGLLEIARLGWAARFGGAHCDDITVAVAFVPAGLSVE